MSTRNPNVFYEAGYADAKKKLVLFLTNEAADIPFDLKHKPHIVYGGSIVKLKADLTERLRWAAKEVASRQKEPLRLTVTMVKPVFDRDEFTDTVKAKIRLEVHNISDAPVTGVHAFIFLGTRTGG